MNGPTIHESTIQKHATAATIGLFAITGITGLLLFFHLGASFFKGIHEWLGVLFVIASVFHVVRNGRAFLRLMARPRTLVVCGMALAVSAVMLVGAGSQQQTAGGDPVRSIMTTMAKASVSEVAVLLHEPADAVVARLQGAGAAGANATQSLSQISEQSGIDLRRLLGSALNGAAAQARP